MTWEIVKDKSETIFPTDANTYSTKRGGVRAQSGSSIAKAIGQDADNFGLHAMVYLIDSDFNVKYVNDSVAEKFQCRACDMVGKSAWNLLGKLDSKTGKQNLVKSMEKGTPFQKTSEVTFPTGPRILATVLFPIRNKRGKISELLGVSYDVTGHHAREQMVRNKMEVIMGYADMLESLVDDEKARKMIDRIKIASTDLRSKL